MIFLVVALFCFFKFGHVATILLEDSKTVTADWYVNHCLPKVFQAWCKLNGVPERVSVIYCASTHTTAATFDFLATSDVQLVTRPPHSPDLASCDWFLFPLVKRQLKGKQFQKAEDTRAFFEGVILDIPQSRLSVVIDNWFVRMIRCVQDEGGFLRKTGVDRVVVSVVEKSDCKK